MLSAYLIQDQAKLEWLQSIDLRKLLLCVFFSLDHRSICIAMDGSFIVSSLQTSQVMAVVLLSLYWVVW